jgi:hypothetical protein
MDYRLSPRVRVVVVRSLLLDSSGFAESGGIWSQVGDAIVDANDRFGRSVSIADNGSRLAASSFHDGSRDIFACSISQVAGVQWIWH